MDITVNADNEKKNYSKSLLISKHLKHYANSFEYIQQHFKENENLQYKNKEYNKILSSNKFLYYLFKIFKKK